MKHIEDSGFSQSAHTPVMDVIPVKTSLCSWLQWLVTMLIPASVTLQQWIILNSFKCMHL